ncbi:maleylpyruvate isomerase family mycothiol-dependent enzyme [Sanguibacter sp. Leaf3]|uniref:maleylpyruvate isomerase family mycothiol-dependent enzyme n=1 Tax=Sanguibacter sp. Leaf3 TaxID=1736209 RepID=UPI0009E7E14A|nr:maleylpyruvate isomerase family mycothiol-dependent enzyme [Sanguibacter sp. Leaf3]
MTRTTSEQHWEMIRAERGRLGDDLEALRPAEWSAPTLCADWSVEDVVAHLTAGASIGRWGWLRSIAGAGFRPAVHNARRLAEHRGPTPAQTLDRFRGVVDSRVAPTGDLWAWLGEVVVHGSDVREPLGIRTAPDPDAVLVVAEGYVRKDFAVASRSTARGLRLVATDSSFRAGDGPTVEGTTLDLVLAMAGRPTAASRLRGDGASVLVERLPL